MSSVPSELVHDHDPAWAEVFRELGARLRRSLGAHAVRIDHVGSTAVPGLAAKPIIDVQVSVTALDDVATYGPLVEACGLAWRQDNEDRSKRYFRELPGARRTHVHVREAGSFGEQVTLLFRDYLRTHPADADAYAAVKRRHAPLLLTDRQAYVDAKSPFVWATIQAASTWAQHTGWRAGPSDA